eukprot:jgi/Psemu1/33910/gm1.33910_g
MAILSPGSVFCSSSSPSSLDSAVYGRSTNTTTNNNPMLGSMMMTRTMADTVAATLALVFDLQALLCSDLGDWCIHSVQTTCCHCYVILLPRCLTYKHYVALI